MNRGGKAALLIACIGLAGCAVAAKEVKVTAIPDPSAALLHGGDELAVARGQLVLGNVGLALEGFRKARRSAPTDAAPLAGIGDCYAMMGRFDLAQSNYEAALAFAPNDRRLLLGLAAIFEREGDRQRAAVARADAERAVKPAPPQAIAQAGGTVAQRSDIQFASQDRILTGSVTVKLPPARPADHLESAGVPTLPPIEDVAALPSSITVPLPPARRAPRPARPEPQAFASERPAPRLERLSRGEVALVTTGKPIWRAQAETRAALAAGVRWVALSPTPGRPNVQVLNAAQTQGIAASARAVLLNRGWRRIAIANAPAVQQRSVVLYSKDRAKLGRSLAAQFGIGARMVERDVLVLVLGRDVLDRIAGQQRS